MRKLSEVDRGFIFVFERFSADWSFTVTLKNCAREEEDPKTRVQEMIYWLQQRFAFRF